MTRAARPVLHKRWGVSDRIRVPIYIQSRTSQDSRDRTAPSGDLPPLTTTGRNLLGKKSNVVSCAALPQTEVSQVLATCEGQPEDWARRSTEKCVAPRCDNWRYEDESSTTEYGNATFTICEGDATYKLHKSAPQILDSFPLPSSLLCKDKRESEIKTVKVLKGKKLKLMESSMTLNPESARNRKYLVMANNFTENKSREKTTSLESATMLGPTTQSSPRQVEARSNINAACNSKPGITTLSSPREGLGLFSKVARNIATLVHTPTPAPTPRVHSALSLSPPQRVNTT